MPWTDPQFWIVTGAALAGVVTLVRQFLPSKDPESNPCARCPSGSAAKAKADTGGLVRIGE